MLTWLKISHHSNSGRLQPHEHTSYVPLGFLLLLVGLALTAYTAFAASPPPQAGSIGLVGTVPGKPPVKAAVITSPNDQQHVNTSPIIFSGSCPINTLVEIFKNDIFAGSALCNTTGSFTLDVDLLFGKNTLVARVYDSLNQPGPDSKSITIFYDALAAQAGPITSLDFGGAQLLLNTDAVFRGIFPEQALNIPISILGGTPPYAVNIQWGDSNNSVVPRNDNAMFQTPHSYKKPGTYLVSIQASDAVGRVAFLAVASIVNGQPSPAASSTDSSSSNSAVLNNLLVLWPLYVGAIAVVASFWIGEQREKYILNKHELSLPS